MHVSATSTFDGNVGIGTAPSSYALEVNGNIKLTPSGAINKTIDFGQAFGNAALYLYNAGTGLKWGWGLNGGEMQFFGTSTVGGSQHISFNKGGDLQASGSNEVMRIVLDSGNVGIGTTSPGQKLEVAQALAEGAGVYSQVTDVTTGRNIKMGVYRPSGISQTYPGIWLNQATPTDTNYAFLGDTAFTFFNAPSGGQMNFGIGNVYKMVMNSSGNVGIGTTSPLSKLHSKESGAKTAVNYAGYFENIATNTTTDAIDKYGAYITSTGGFAGLGGTATNNYGLYIDAVSGGDNNYPLVVKDLPTSANASNVFYDSTTGILYRSTSSERYKTNIQPLQFDYRQVLNIPIKQWNMKTGGSLGIGMVAEEVAALNMPELVIYNSAGQPDGIQWDRVTSYMLGVVKDQQKEIDALNLALTASGTIGNASSTPELASGNGIGDWLANGLESLGLGLQNGIASLKEIVAGKVTTKEMCVTGTDGETICVSKDELKQMLLNSGATSGSSIESGSSSGSNTSSGGSGSNAADNSGGSGASGADSGGGLSGSSGEGTATSTPEE